MTNILHQEIQNAIDKAICDPDDNSVLYDFSNVKKVLQENPDLINSTDSRRNTLLNIFAQLGLRGFTLSRDYAVENMTLMDILAYNPDPFIKNNTGKLPLDYVDKNLYSYAELSNYQTSFTAHSKDLLNHFVALYGAKKSEEDIKTRQSLSAQDIFHLEIQNVLKNRAYNQRTCRSTYDFSYIKMMLEDNPLLIDSQNEEGNTLLHIFLKLQDKEITGLTLDDILKHKPNPALLNNCYLMPINLVLKETSDYRKLSTYQNNFIKLAFQKKLRQQHQH